MAQAKAQIDLIANSDQLTKEVKKSKDAMAGLGEKMKETARFLDRNFTKTFDSATDSVEDFGDAAKDAGNKTSGGSDSLASRLGKLSTGFAAVAVAAVAVVAVLVKVGKFAIKTGKEMDALGKKSRAMGVSISELQALNLGAALSGVNADEAIRAMTKLGQRVGEAKNGSVTAMAAFEALGLSLDDLAKMKLNERFEAVGSRLNAIGDSTERAALANQLFEESWQSLGPLLNEGADAMARAVEEQEKMDEFWGRVDTTSVEKLNDEFTILVANIKQMAMVSVGSFASMARALSVMTGEVKSFSAAFAEVAQLDNIAEQKKFRADRVRAGIGQLSDEDFALENKKKKNVAQKEAFDKANAEYVEQQKVAEKLAAQQAKIDMARRNAQGREEARKRREDAAAFTWAQGLRDKSLVKERDVVLKRKDSFQAGFESLIGMNRRIQSAAASTAPEDRTAKATEESAQALKEMKEDAKTSAVALEKLVDTYGDAALFG